MHGALGELEASCRQRAPGSWLIDDRLTQADITVACLGTLLDDSLNVFGSGDPAYPTLSARVARCEALPEFQATRTKWFAAVMETP